MGLKVSFKLKFVFKRFLLLSLSVMDTSTIEYVEKHTNIILEMFLFN